MSTPPWFSKLYNAGIHQYTWKLTLPKIMSPSFYHTELNRALSEQAFGLARFDIFRSSSPHEATASVTLIEGRTIRITLTARGYQLDGDQIFESIEGLLQSVSTAYEGRRREALFSRLRSLS
ncbi:hypothetical protein DEU56DRAFT_817829 [Suillus clintonianus]|uniref:uncharacterized protein n=1 Tax=Suillus clintonianus TaxID=1904413 RepID=UPI001B85EAE0|nr:uncharacterized protein DEU56DRAFT_817829 [Suillus clintonianus]KAG2129124.1 hypothetical protein DEU56DRAFT_817829 [Suillus clintonianus]